MCEVCVQQARRDFANWPESQQRVAKLALRERSDAVMEPRAATKARDEQLSRDAEMYRRVVPPRRAHLLAAVDQAEDMLRNGRSPAAVLDVLLTNVRTDATAIPATLPI